MKLFVAAQHRTKSGRWRPKNGSFAQFLGNPGGLQVIGRPQGALSQPFASIFAQP
ncbi:hypothetical protein [Burkholderia pseudomallei]|uniref:hypothetical protein n=1 Tax=Burkholderia pseudomallei TaxID=28450 RepID=UPI00137715BE|nr:hypothetical protein [Burkholderia pseudomallei]